MVSERFNVEMSVMILMVCMSFTIMPSLAQENPLGLPICWAKMEDCATDAGIDSKNPLADYTLCCPVIKPQVANKTCFCSIKEYIQNIPNDQPAVVSSALELASNKIFADCKIGTTFDQLCNGVSKSEVASETGNLSGIAKNGAIKIASAMSVPGALFLWMMLIS